MKKLSMYLIGAFMAFSLVACTPTPEKANKASDEANISEENKIAATTGGASDKVPDPTAEELTVISVFVVNDKATGLDKAMDALSVLDAQPLIDKMAEYGVIEEGTKVVKFDKKDTTATLDISQLKPAGSGNETLAAVAIVNTFIENFELDSLNLQVNGKSYTESHIKQAEDGSLAYVGNYSDLLK